ncbi:hypothetical protein [Hyalangium minutum]|uniref:Uncharacterized protein n=1 Tax=Hyalangium minutum TaxID=394096 RepID=A0A085WUH0_9BACT|nr:hypothetical protein [Hyalangium minutum]KFE71333.1 hypothetical protein DB31_3463 [Hyalangium minutum]
MLNVVQQVIIAVSFIAFVVLVVYLFVRRHKARVAAWAEFARRHDMCADGLKIEGSYEGYPMRLELQIRGSGKERYTVTVLRLSTNGGLSPDFSLEQEGLGDKLLKLFGRKDAEIGDKAFDRLFELNNVSRETARVLRNESVQQHLYEMANHYRDFHIRAGWIHAEHRKIPSTVEELEELTGPALMLAHTLEEASRRSKGWTEG